MIINKNHFFDRFTIVRIYHHALVIWAVKL